MMMFSVGACSSQNDTIVLGVCPPTVNAKSPSNPKKLQRATDSFAYSFHLSCSGVGLASGKPRPEKRVPPPRDSEEYGARTRGCRRFGRTVWAQGICSTRKRFDDVCCITPVSNSIPRDDLVMCACSQLAGQLAALHMFSPHPRENNYVDVAWAIVQRQNRRSMQVICQAE